MTGSAPDEDDWPTEGRTGVAPAQHAETGADRPGQREDQPPAASVSPPATRFTRPARRQRWIILLAVLALGLGLIVWQTQRHTDRGAPKATTSRTGPSSAASRTAPLGALVTATDVRSGAMIAQLPEDERIPVDDAARAYLPEVLTLKSGAPPFPDEGLGGGSIVAAWASVIDPDDRVVTIRTSDGHEYSLPTAEELTSVPQQWHVFLSPRAIGPNGLSMAYVDGCVIVTVDATKPKAAAFTTNPSPSCSPTDLHWSSDATRLIESADVATWMIDPASGKVADAGPQAGPFLRSFFPRQDTVAWSEWTAAGRIVDRLHYRLPVHDISEPSLADRAGWLAARARPDLDRVETAQPVASVIAVGPDDPAQRRMLIDAPSRPDAGRCFACLQPVAWWEGRRLLLRSSSEGGSARDHFVLWDIDKSTAVRVGELEQPAPEMSLALLSAW